MISDDAYAQRISPASLATQFCKSGECPPAQDILAYHSPQPIGEVARRVRQHLEFCDFCNAELQLLARHRTSSETSMSPELPTSLRALAERLLSCGV
jgi:hypothetical protein